MAETEAQQGYQTQEYDDGSEQQEDEEGDVIDVEEEDDDARDDDNEVFPYPLEYFKQKLREKPQFEPEPTDCGTACPKKTYDGYSVPAEDRLSAHQHGSLELYRKLTPFPRGVIPPLSLPSWHFIPLEKMIPLLNHSPKDLLYYTRGKLGEQLYRSPVEFDILDPYRRERIIRDPYTTLHDPHVKGVFSIPAVRRLLYKHKMINQYDEVLCTFAEFNRYRDYLRVQYCDNISRQLAHEDALFKHEREQLRTLLQEVAEISRNAIRAKNEAAQRFKLEMEEYKLQKLRQKEGLVEARLRQWRLDKQQAAYARIAAGANADARGRDRQALIANLRLQQRRAWMTKTWRKIIETEERRRSDKLVMQAAYDKFLLEWIESKYVYCYEKLMQRKQMQKELHEAGKYNARKRLARLERYREQLPHLLAKKKAEEERLWAVVRKYAMRWLNRVRARLNAPKDVKHESCWIGQGKHVLEDIVKYLRQESGYEKLDDFILNIMKLKKQIQHQMEMEEAEEAAALARLQAEEEEEEEENEVGVTGSMMDTAEGEE